MSRYGGFKGKFDFKRFKEKFTRLFGSYDDFDESFGYTTFSGIHDLSVTSTSIQDGIYTWNVGERLLVNPNIPGGPFSDNWSNTLSRYTVISGNPAPIVFNLEPYDVDSSIAKLTIPIDGTYTIEVAGASSFTMPNLAYTPGEGAILRATYTLNQDEVLWLIVGQTTPEQNPNFSRNWQGGAGGTFVSFGPNLATSNPLLVAGGGGGLRTATPSTGDIDRINGQMTTSGGSGASVTDGTVGGQYGNRGAGGGHNQNPSPAGAPAGFYQNGTAHGDNRAHPTGYTHAGARAAINGARGATFVNTFDTLYLGHGGFGGGGPGGWGGMGGAGGYSGGGNGDNGTGEIGGGGGSFIANFRNPTNVGTSTGTWAVVNSISHPTAPWVDGAGLTVGTQTVTGLTVLGFNPADTPGYISITRTS